MAIQSNVIVFIFFGFAGLLLLGLIIFLAYYFSRSGKRGDVEKHTKPLVEPKADLSDIEMVEDIKTSPDYTRLVTFGRMVNDDRFAVRFDDEWITEPTKLSFVQKNRLEKNLAEAQRWLGIEPLQAGETQDTPGKPYEGAVVPPLVPEKVVEKHKRQMSIVEQVDDILQELLESRPMVDKQIRLTEMPNKGVIVWVGNEYYEGINAVPDEDVKRIIRKAVKKWEEVSGA